MLDGFFASLAIIFATEVGDKTFLIACVLAMRHPRALILAAACAALWLMTVLSAALGHFLPNLLSRYYTQLLAALLFVGFGAKMFHEALHMSSTASCSEELEEVTHELNSEGGGEDLELSSDSPSKTAAPASLVPPALAAAAAPVLRSLRNLLDYVFSPIFIQTFIMNFVAEWGDRSQIATIALAGSHGFWSVTLGAMLAHFLCTGIAVVGGRMIATRISVRTVTLGGAILFILSGIWTLYELRTGALTVESDPAAAAAAGAAKDDPLVLER